MVHPQSLNPVVLRGFSRIREHVLPDRSPYTGATHFRSEAAALRCRPNGARRSPRRHAPLDSNGKAESFTKTAHVKRGDVHIGQSSAPNARVASLASCPESALTLHCICQLDAQASPCRPGSW